MPATFCCMDWRGLDKTWERLRWARLKAGFERPTDAARSLDIKPVTYRTYEHGPADGGREPSLTELQRMARKYKVDWIWLASGQRTPDIPDPDEPDVAEITEGIRRLPKAARGDAAAAALGVIQAFARRKS